MKKAKINYTFSPSVLTQSHFHLDFIFICSQPQHSVLLLQYSGECSYEAYKIFQDTSSFKNVKIVSRMGFHFAVVCPMPSSFPQCPLF